MSLSLAAVFGPGRSRLVHLASATKSMLRAALDAARKDVTVTAKKKRAQHFSGANSQSRFDWDRDGLLVHIRSFISAASLPVAHLYPLGL